LFAHLGSKNNDRKANDRKAGGRVRSSQYLRAQAQLYFDIARLLSEPKAIEEASATATQYLCAGLRDGTRRTHFVRTGDGPMTGAVKCRAHCGD
jgi:hypothetical protein